MANNMTDIKITDLPTATTIDGTTDTFPIVNSALDETQQISRNVLLGITGNPVGTTDPQTITTKTLDNTNTITLKDNLFTLQDGGGITRQAQFQLSGITAGQTRTYTLPDASSTLMDIATTQSASNKTFITPTITSGMNITSGTLAVTGNETVGGTLAVTGVLTPTGGLSANSVTNTNLAGGITQAKLATTAGDGPLKSKLVVVTRDGTAASGDVSYTGAGFIPSSLLAHAHVDNTTYRSDGLADASKTCYSTFQSAANVYYDNASLIVYSNQSAWGQTAIVKSYDADGFTLTWTKAGSPTAGTIKCNVICYR